MTNTNTLPSAPRILIVEDEALISEHIAMCLEELGYEITGIADTAAQALQLIEDLRPDLILLDINLIGPLDGVDLAGQIQARFGIPFIYLTSNTDSRTLERVKMTQPSGFIVKPYQPSDLEANVGIALYKNRQALLSADHGDESFFVKDKSALKKIRYQEVFFAEAMDNYVRLHTEKGRFVVSQTLKATEEKLKGKGFLRVHRSYLVNLGFIEQIHHRHLIIHDQEIPVSESHKAELMRMIEVF